MRLRTARGASLFFFAAFVVAACTSHGTPCSPGDYRYCDCPNKPGYQQCSVSGDGYGACDCSGNFPSVLDAAAEDAPSDAPDSGLLPFLSPCTTNEQCATNLCYPFNAFGPHCSKPCKIALDCPPPSPGCSNMGVCKLQ